MRVTHAGIYLQKLVMVYSLLVVNIRVIYLKHMSVENTSVHRQEIFIQILLLVLSIKTSTINLKLDYVCASLQIYSFGKGINSIMSILQILPQETCRLFMMVEKVFTLLHHRLILFHIQQMEIPTRTQFKIQTQEDSFTLNFTMSM